MDLLVLQLKIERKKEKFNEKVFKSLFLKNEKNIIDSFMKMLLRNV